MRNTYFQSLLPTIAVSNFCLTATSISALTDGVDSNSYTASQGGLHIQSYNTEGNGHSVASDDGARQ